MRSASQRVVDGAFGRRGANALARTRPSLGPRGEISWARLQTPSSGRLGALDDVGPAVEARPGGHGVATRIDSDLRLQRGGCRIRERRGLAPAPARDVRQLGVPARRKRPRLTPRTRGSARRRPDDRARAVGTLPDPDAVAVRVEGNIRAIDSGPEPETSCGTSQAPFARSVRPGRPRPFRSRAPRRPARLRLGRARPAERGRHGRERRGRTGRSRCRGPRGGRSDDGGRGTELDLVAPVDERGSDSRLLCSANASIVQASAMRPNAFGSGSSRRRIEPKPFTTSVDGTDS